MDFKEATNLLAFKSMSIFNYNIERSEPPIAPVTTTIHGGSFQYTNMLNKIAAKAKLMGANTKMVLQRMLNQALLTPKESLEEN
jgi:hypothetical protein